MTLANPLISLSPPDNFDPKVSVSACYLEIERTILLLERAPKSLEGSTWGVPAGKVELDESPQEAAIRELFEETGVRALPDQTHAIGTLYIRKGNMDYTYHMFAIHLKERPIITLNSEHTRFLWTDPAKIYELPLISGAHEALRIYRELKKIVFKGGIL